MNFSLEHIEKYLEGNLKGEELAAFESKLNSDPDFASEVSDFQIAIKGIEQNQRLALKSKLEAIHTQVMKPKPMVNKSPDYCISGFG